MSSATRLDVIRALNAEFVFVRKTFPMGVRGLLIKDGIVTPDDNMLASLAANYGPAARPGDRAQITDVIIKPHGIIFEINGGPQHKKKWYQRLTIGSVGGEAPIAPDRSPQNPTGSFVLLQFDKNVPDLSPEQLKKMLAPVFDFTALSATQAYVDTLPPKVRDAVKKHEVLVGMNRDMVTIAKGRPTQKIRERDEQGNDYEEWIYGTPPEDVEFIRFYGDESRRVEIMKVTGEKILRTQPEMDATQTTAQPTQPSAQPTANQSTDRPPSLRRPGEALPGDEHATQPVTPSANPAPNPPSQPPPQMLVSNHISLADFD